MAKRRGIRFREGVDAYGNKGVVFDWGDQDDAMRAARERSKRGEADPGWPPWPWERDDYEPPEDDDEDD